MLVIYSYSRDPERREHFSREFPDLEIHHVRTEQELDWAFQGGELDGIILGKDLSLKERERVLSLGLQAGVMVGIVPGLYESFLIGSKTVNVQGEPLLMLHSPKERRNLLREGLARLSAGLALLALTPILLGLGILVKFDSPGPVFYGQQRVGIENRPFRLWKFRTMYQHAEAQSGPIFCQANDQRVTRMGGILRRSHLDELPQLWNILRGEMEWVGPRPERPVFVRQFEERLPAYGLRHLVKPGLTGEAQVNLDYASSPEAKLVYDLQHLRERKTLDQARVLLATLPALFHWKGPR